MYGGATQLKFKSNRYPNVAEFLNQQYPELYDIAVALNRIQVLASMKPTGFILPDEKDRKKLVAMIQGDDPEGGEDMFLSLIMLGDYTQPKNAEKGINSGTGYQISVEKVDKDMICIEGGGKLTLCKDFQPFNKRTGKNKAPCKHVVWNLSGSIKMSSKQNIIDLPKFSSIVGKGESISEFDELFADLTKNKLPLVSKFREKLGKWCHWANGADQASLNGFLLVKSGSPTIDYLMVFHSGVFGEPDDMPDIEKPAECYNTCTWKGNAVDASVIRDRVKDRVFSKYSKARAEYDVFIKDPIFNNTVFANNASALFSLHAFIFYGNEVMERLYNKDHDSAELIKTMFDYVKENEGFARDGKTLLDASRFALDENDLNGLYSAFIENMAFKAPVSVNIVHGAADEDMSSSAMEELRAYVKAYGRYPQV